MQNKDNPEQTKFDFPGYTLKGCLGSDLSKPKRQVAKLPSKQAQRYLKELFPFLQGENEDFVKAKNVLTKMQADSSLTDPDKAQMYYYFAYIDSINDDIKSAKKNYKKCLRNIKNEWKKKIKEVRFEIKNSCKIVNQKAYKSILDEQAVYEPETDNKYFIFLEF